MIMQPPTHPIAKEAGRVTAIQTQGVSQDQEEFRFVYGFSTYVDPEKSEAKMNFMFTGIIHL